METREQILSRSFSESFVSKIKCIKERLELYEKTHNTEYLVDVANFAMLEFMFPSFKDSSYIPTDSDKSPGLADGISYKELMESCENEF